MEYLSTILSGHLPFMERTQWDNMHGDPVGVSAPGDTHHVLDMRIYC